MSEETPSQEPGRRKRTAAKKPADQPVNSDWKNHPVLIVGGAVTATALVCLTYFNEFALPQRTSRLEDEAFRATEEAERLTSELSVQHKLVSASQKKIAGLQNREKYLENLLSEARTVDMFQSGSAYPNGFATVKVGMTTSDVYAAYPKEAVTLNERGYLSVDLANSPFSRATYYYDQETGSEVITHILFQIRRKYDDDRKVNLVKRMSENLGRPLTIPPDRYAWAANDNVNVFIDDDYGYLIMAPGSRPGDWPTEREIEIVCGMATQAAQQDKCPIPNKK